MAQPQVFLTLNLPERGLTGRPIIASWNPILLRLFKQFVIMDWQERIKDAPTEEDAIVEQIELSRLHSLLDAFIPTNGNTPEGVRDEG